MTEQNGGSAATEAPEKEAHTVTISEQAAQVLMSICRQLTIHDAASKVNVGKAQMELEVGLAKLHPPEKPVVIPRAARRRAQKVAAVKG